MDESEGALIWGEDGQPRSRLYGDVYFSTSDGLAESRAVFLQGAGLPEAWAGRQRFTVAELGFGSGLNIAALLDLWRTTRPDGARLHIFSIEAHPLTAQEAARALAAWPEIAEVADLMVARWPGRARGVHRTEFPELDAILDVAIGGVEVGLAGWDGQADAWFLDGFSPAVNPAMWRDEVLAAVAARSAPGARAATFTVAGQVRRGLAAAGFVVSKRPGFGRKRERLEAVFPGDRPQGAGPVRVAVIGAGVAGASVARALRALGVSAAVVEAAGVGAGASGNPVALVTPRFDAGLGDPAELAARAFARAVTLYEATAGVVVEHGVTRLVAEGREAARMAKIAGADLFEPDELTLGEALAIRRALVVVPPAILSAWLPALAAGHVAAIRRDGVSWRLEDETGAEILKVDVVVVAAGLGAAALLGDLGLSPVRGQLTIAPGATGAAMEWGGYVAGSPIGLAFGATHDRGDTGLEVREADHARNLATLAQACPDLAARLVGRSLIGRASVRAATADHMPIAGAIGEGLYVLGGFGGRGFSFAPLLAEHVAAKIAGAASPLPRRLARLIDPTRFRSPVSKPADGSYVGVKGKP
ncbi:tRNA (5-methylaminomethyl-2-thiouridine)(34)-methyltransferase MnmD [Phenylobacterium immobile]|uniref:tRNA (5-methylaminomethyl-2-thiouridine)(34)-methyltransferase MnmD n=1 Tax=Phenylobacterium immobile TaxID=21 RepID=UPI000AB17CD7|nr:tRNA (5-methylaminomethyl-2-thiouridine)(34)-methyltransferase MnmD [Phenylobacterium immobile]